MNQYIELYKWNHKIMFMGDVLLMKLKGLKDEPEYESETVLMFFSYLLDPNKKNVRNFGYQFIQLA